jgi:hypothetical protein
MKTTLLTFLMMLSVFAAMAQQSKNATPLPDTNNVSLPLDEYNKLVQQAANPPKKPIVPPVSYSLKRADIKLRVDNDHVSGTIQLDGETFRKGMMKVPLTMGMTILEARQEGKPVPLQQENGSQVAILSGPSEFSITLNPALPLAIEAGRASFNFFVPPSGSAQVTLTVPGEHTSVNLSPGLITSRASDKGNTTVEATLVPGQQTTLWWATRETAAPVVPREVRFLSNVKTLVSVSEADVRLAALADISVVQGDPAQFELEVPAGYEVTGVTGASLESSEAQSGTLVLKVSTPSQRSHQFLISLERSITETKETVPFLTFKNTQREIGEVLVEGAGTMELAATEGGSLKRMDVKETNPYLRSLAHFPPQAAFRYHRQPNESPSLALAWVRFPDSSVLAAVAESAEITTMVTTEGRSLTEVKLTVKNQAQPFLKVALPAGATILTADVAGEKVKPVQGSDGNRVPLLRPGFRPDGPYTISFVFMHSGAAFAKKGSSELSLPGMDIPISLLQWEVFLPEQYKVKDFAGDVIAANRVPPAMQEGSGIGYGYGVGIGSGSGVGVGPGHAGGVVGGLVRNNIYAPLLPGQLAGTVSDPSGAPIGGASVSITNVETGVNISASTDGDGRWTVSNLASGRYKIIAESSGFNTTVHNVVYNAERPGNFNFTLNVGSMSETVTVEAEAVTEVPLTGRNMTELSQLKPGVAEPGPASANVVNLQRRVAGVLPVAIDVPRAGTSFKFVRPLVLNEETKVTFSYKNK